MTETAREVFERLLAENPQFVKAPKTGQARRCRGTGRRPTGTCSSSAQEKRRSIAPASRTSPVFGLRKPPLSSVEGFCGRQFDPASPFFAPMWLRGCKALTRSASPFRRCAVRLRRSGPHPKAPIGAAEKHGGKHARAARLLGGSFRRFPLIHQAQSATDQVRG